MTIQISVSDEIVQKLEKRAAERGETVESYSARVLSDTVTKPNIEEILGPFRKQVADSGMNDEELDDMLRQELEGYRRDKKGALCVNVIFDTMVLLQIAARPQRVHASWQAVIDGRITLFISDELLAEIEGVMSRDYILRRFSEMTPAVAKAFAADLHFYGKLLNPVWKSFSWPHHPNDDHLFDLAIAAKADRLVTWENRILDMPTKFSTDFDRLSKLAPQLCIVNPKDLSDELRTLKK